MNAPRFIDVGAQRVRQLACRFREQGTRAIVDVHVHATRSPSIEDFKALVETLDNREEPAGQAVCQQLWRRHTGHHGWAHIGPHLVIDPHGTVWIGRAWDLPPVSVSGHNGNVLSGPLCVAVIGDIDPDREAMSARQREALVCTLAGLLDGLELDPDQLRDLSELGVTRHGPGMQLDTLRADVDKQRSGSADEPVDTGRKRPLGEREDNTHRLLRCLLDDADSLPLSVRRIEAACGLDDDRESDLEHRVSRRSRGGASGFTLTPQRRRTLKRHVINLRQGEFSNTGDFCTTEADLAALIDRSLTDWIAARKPDAPPPKLMIYAHGGLNREEAGLAYAASLIDWWLANDIYPIFFVWETGLIESLLQLIEQKIGGSGRGIGDDLRSAVFGVRDAAVEALVRQLGQDFWAIMKTSARRASETRPTSGAYQLALKLHALRKIHPKLECHAIGHSAGAIFQAYFLAACYQGARKVPFESLSLLAPACTVGLFREKLLWRIDGKRIKRLNLFNLDVVTEREDPTVPIYGKSLLHLVSDGFEERRDTPILGMERAIDGDAELASSLGLGAVLRQDIEVVFSPSEAGAPESLRAAATTHGGLSSDPVTLASLARLILPVSQAGDVTPPEIGTGGGRGVGERLFEPLSSRIDAQTYAALFRPTGAVVGPARALAHPAVPGPRTVAPTRTAGPSVAMSGVRRALCIGIDKYPGDAELHGCVSDALAWQASLAQLGFEVNVLLDEAATYRGILDAVARTVTQARPGDVIAIQYSGHGIQFPDADGDEEDAKDEALVPFDSAHQYFVSDDELWDSLQAVADSVQLYVFMDCCHSRSNSRAYARASEGATDASARRARRMVPDPAAILAHRERLLPRRRALGDEPKPIEAMRHIKFSACHDHEEAFEEDGQGNFSRAALAVLGSLEAAGTDMSNEAIRLAIEENFRPDARQQPGLECPTHLKRQPFFGGVWHG